MDINILDIFYKNVVPEATTGRIDCNFYYNLAFSTKIVDENIQYWANINDESLLIPTLIIKDKSLFDKLLIEYVNLAMDFYDFDCWDDDITDYKMYDEDKRICQEKVILSLLFANATIEDFNNPCEYLRKRINFINNDITGLYNLGYFDYFQGDLSISIEKDVINNETPYQIIIIVTSNNGEEFEFPRVKFGISDDTVYIYAIQNKINENNSFCKKINRTLYKIGEGFNEEYEVDGENLKDITSSFLVVLNMCISFLEKFEYNNIVVPSCLIERWNAKSIANTLKSLHAKMDIIDKNKLVEEQNKLQMNLTNKLIRTFLRLGCHYNNIDILSIPYEIDSCLHIFINNNPIICNNDLLYDTYMFVQSKTNKKYR